MRINNSGKTNYSPAFSAAFKVILNDPKNLGVSKILKTEKGSIKLVAESVANSSDIIDKLASFYDFLQTKGKKILKSMPKDDVLELRMDVSPVPKMLDKNTLMNSVRFTKPTLYYNSANRTPLRLNYIDGEINNGGKGVEINRGAKNAITMINDLGNYFSRIGKSSNK